jgi:hypothetical protein
MCHVVPQFGKKKNDFLNKIAESVLIISIHRWMGLALTGNFLLPPGTFFVARPTLLLNG